MMRRGSDILTYRSREPQARNSDRKSVYSYGHCPDHEEVTLDPARLLPYVMSADDTSSPSDMIDVLALAAFTVGTEPHAAAAQLHEVGQPQDETGLYL
jgi:hypothetical protein